MRGHLPLIALRMRGRCPDAAFVTVGEDPLRSWRTWPAWLASSPFAAIEIQPQDRVCRLDLRCLVGMQVHVAGDDEARVFDVAERCVQEHAGTVFAVAHDTGRTAFFDKESNSWQAF